MSDDTRTKVRYLVLGELRELHRKQDEQLRSWRNAARGIPLAVVSAGTIVIAAARDFGDVYAVTILVSATLLVVLTAVAEVFALSWKPGSDISRLEECAGEAAPDAGALEEEVIATSAEHYLQNKECLARVRGVCGFQALAVLASAIALTIGLANLPPGVARQQDRLNEQVVVVNQLFQGVSQELTRLDLEVQSLSEEVDGLGGGR